MKVIKPDEVASEAVSSAISTGGLLTIQPLVTETLGKDFNILLVNFSKGARNTFHIHSCDQVLIITSGRGIVATEHEQQFVKVRDVILITAGEKHWHGANEDSDFSHISILLRESETTHL